MGAQNGQIWMASDLIDIKLDVAHNGGYRSLRDRRAVTVCNEARLAKQVPGGQCGRLPPGSRWRAGRRCHRRRVVSRPPLVFICGW